MPTYIAHEYLNHDGVIIQTGQEVELTEDQAYNLGRKVSLSERQQLEEYTVPELKEQAKKKGLEKVSDLKKDELIDVLVEKK